MHAFTALALAAATISTANAGVIAAREPHLCLFGISLFGGCAAPTTQSTCAATQKGSGPCANGAAVSSTYTAANGDLFGICLNTLFQVNDISSHSATSLSFCADICSRTLGCLSATWNRSSNTCGVKKTVPCPVSSSGTDSHVKLAEGNKSSSTSAKPTTTSTVKPSVVEAYTNAAPKSTATASATPEPIIKTVTVQPSVAPPVTMTVTQQASVAPPVTMTVTATPSVVTVTQWVN